MASPYSADADILQTKDWGLGDGTKANREDLDDAMTIADPTDTPGLARFGDTKASAVDHSWLEKGLKDPKSAQTQAGAATATSLVGGAPEGAGYNPTTRPVPVRRTNFLQIFEEHFSVSRTQMQVNTAGRPSDKLGAEAREAVKETMRAIEARFWSVLFSAGDDGSTGNSRLAKTAEKLFNYSGAGNVRALGTAGTPAAATEDDILALCADVMDDCGGGGSYSLYAHHRQKIRLNRILSGIGGAGSEAPLMRSTSVDVVPASVRRYDTDLGEIELVANRWVTQETETVQFDSGSVTEATAVNSGGLNEANAAGRIWLIRNDQVKVAWLQKPVPVDVAKRGDSMDGMVVAECTYEVKGTEKFHGVLTRVKNA